MASYKYNRIRKPLTIKEVQLRLSQAIEEAERVLLTADDENTRLQAIYALSNASKTYLSLMDNIFSLRAITETLKREKAEKQFNFDQLTIGELEEFERLLLKADVSDTERVKRLE